MILRKIIFAFILLGYFSQTSGKRNHSQLVSKSKQINHINLFAPIDIGGDCDTARGDECVSEQEGRSSCENGKCTCKPTNPPSKDKKSCLVKIRQNCNTNDECVSREDGPDELGGYPSSCATGTCQCNSNYVQTPDFSKCLRIQNELDKDGSCEHSRQCEAGLPGSLSECTNGKCTCKSEAANTPGGHICYELAKSIGDSCEVDVQCNRRNAHCNGVPGTPGTCYCGTGYVKVPSDLSQCFEVKKYDEVCLFKEQCSSVDPNSECKEKDGDTSGKKFCMCDALHVVSPNNQECLRKATSIGGACKMNENSVQCAHLNNSQCALSINGISSCECLPPNSVINSNKNGCLPPRQLGGPCSDSAQCQGIDKAFCNVGSCSCSAGYAELGATNCLPIAGINEPCVDHVQCQHATSLGLLSKCRDERCQCSYFYGYFEGKCYIPATLGQYCEKSEECYVGVNKNSWCNQATPRVCACQPGMKTIKGKCYEEKKVGSACETDAECNAYIAGGHAYCDPSRSVCDCKIGYKADSSGLVCSSGMLLLSNQISFILISVIALFLKFSFEI